MAMESRVWLTVREFDHKVSIIQPLTAMPCSYERGLSGVLAVDAAAHLPMVYLCTYTGASRLMKYAQQWVGVRVIDGALEIEPVMGCIPPQQMVDAIDIAMVIEETMQ